VQIFLTVLYTYIQGKFTGWIIKLNQFEDYCFALFELGKRLQNVSIERIVGKHK